MFSLKYIFILNIYIGTDVSRWYTPVPCCLHPDEHFATHNHDDYLCLIVKYYNGGIMTPNLTALKPGQCIELSNALGNFHLEIYDKYSTMHLIAAGTGLTVMLSIIKQTLLRYNT
jgi:predicted ferric reductase